MLSAMTTVSLPNATVPAPGVLYFYIIGNERPLKGCEVPHAGKGGNDYERQDNEIR